MRDIAFTKLKRCLTGPDIMAFPMRDEEFILDTDAGKYSIGAVLRKSKMDKNESFLMPVEP